MSTEQKELQVLTPYEEKYIVEHWDEDSFAGIWYLLKLILGFVLHVLWQMGLQLFNIYITLRGRKNRVYTMDYVRRVVLLAREISKFDIPLTTATLWYCSLNYNMPQWIAITHSIIGLIVWAVSMNATNARFYRAIKAFTLDLNSQGRIENTDSDISTKPLFNN